MTFQDNLTVNSTAGRLWVRFPSELGEAPTLLPPSVHDKQRGEMDAIIFQIFKGPFWSGLASCTSHVRWSTLKSAFAQKRPLFSSWSDFRVLPGKHSWRTGNELYSVPAFHLITCSVSVPHGWTGTFISDTNETHFADWKNNHSVQMEAIWWASWPDFIPCPCCQLTSMFIFLKSFWFFSVFLFFFSVASSCFEHTSLHLVNIWHQFLNIHREVKFKTPGHTCFWSTFLVCRRCSSTLLILFIWSCCTSTQDRLDFSPNSLIG